MPSSVKSDDAKYESAVVPSVRNSASTSAEPERAMKDGFVHALSGALTLSCAVAFAGAALALALVESKKRLAIGDDAAAPAIEPAAPTPEQVAA